MSAAPESISVHASAFAYRGAGCLILGPSGSGKSTVLAQAMLSGAEYIADDQVSLRAESGCLIASAQPMIDQVMELRGLGLIKVPESAIHHPIHLAVTLTDGPIERLPEPQTIRFLEVDLPHYQLPVAPHTPVACLLLFCQAMQEGRMLPQDWSAH